MKSSPNYLSFYQTINTEQINSIDSTIEYVCSSGNYQQQLIPSPTELNIATVDEFNRHSSRICWPLPFEMEMAGIVI